MRSTSLNAISPLKAMLYMALSIQATGYALEVDPSDAPNGCVPPAGNIYVVNGCNTRTKCTRTDAVTGIIPPGGSIVPESSWTDSGDNCDGSQPIQLKTKIDDTSSFEITTTLGTSITSIEAGIQRSAERQVKRGRTQTITKEVTATVGPHESVRYDWYISRCTNRSVGISSTFQCSDRASSLSYLNPLTSVCRLLDQSNGWVSYSGGSPVTSTVTLTDSLVPGITEKTTTMSCPE